VFRLNRYLHTRDIPIFVRLHIHKESELPTIVVMRGTGAEIEIYEGMAAIFVELFYCYFTVSAI
jgi:hypothetical protein